MTIIHHLSVACYTQLIDAIDELKKPKRKRNKGGKS